MHINSLPREIAETIFDMHVYAFRGSRQPLLLVCRHWYSIAITYRALWQSIAFGHQFSVEPATILCPDLKSLALVLKRTGTATFDLYLGAPFFELEEDIQFFMSAVESNWLSRCRYLMVFPNTGDALSSAKLGAIFLTCEFGALNCLEIRHHEGHETWELLLRIIVERMDSSAHRIRTLRIRVDGESEYDTSWITRCLFASTNNLGRISSLQLRGIYEPVPWDNLLNLEELELWTHSQIWPALTFDFPPVPHLTLGHTDTLNALSSSKLWGFLTRLILKDIESNLTNTIYLPSLEFFGLIQCDGLDLLLIDAPKLRELEIRFQPFCYVYPVLENATIKPQVLRIDIQNVAPNSHLLPLVAPSAVWLQVEEVQFRMRGAHPILPSVLSEMLSGVTWRCSPKLRNLTVLYPLLDEIGYGGPHHGDEVKQLEETQKKEVMRIVEARIAHGEKQIDRLELGWYSEHGDDYVHKEWRVVEWIDCL
jgi:F-box-like